MPFTIRDDLLVLDSGLAIEFQRTLRIPDDGRDYPLPAGLGRFPLRRIDDYASRVPDAWREHGGVFLPMYQREAMWISFEAGRAAEPTAVQVGVGKVCALTGEPWSDSLRASPQNYLVTPPQLCIDGIATERGRIRQFVAMPLGSGYTVEGQLTGDEQHGGIQLQVFEPKPGRIRPRRRAKDLVWRDSVVLCEAAPSVSMMGSMGLAAGGRMRQKIYPDPHGLDVWRTAPSARVFVHLAGALLWQRITGETPPPSPVTAEEYVNQQIPWFDLYDEHVPALGGSERLRAVKPVREMDAKTSGGELQDDRSTKVGGVVGLPVEGEAETVDPRPGRVRDGWW